MKKIWIVISGILLGIYSLVLIPSLFMNIFAALILLFLIPIGVCYNGIVTGISVLKYNNSKKRLKFIITLMIYAGIEVLFFFFLTSLGFDISFYIVDVICYLSFLVGFIIIYHNKRRSDGKNNIVGLLLNKYNFDFRIGIIGFNVLLIITSIYIRLTQVFFCIGSKIRNFSIVIRIIGFVILVILIIISLCYLILSIIKRRNHRIINQILTILGTICGECVIGFILIVTCLMSSFCFYPNGYDKSSYDYHENVKQIILEDGNKSFTALYVDNNKEDISLYFPGNGMSAYVTLNTLDYYCFYMDKAESNILIIDYPYFGNSVARLNQDNLFLEADLYYDYIVNELGFSSDHITICGFSIGTGMANYTASRHECKQLVLAAPYDNFVNVINTYLNIFHGPLTNLLEFRFASNEYAEEVKCPVKIIYVLDDKTVPCFLAKNLSTAYKTDVEIFIRENGGHNSAPSDLDFLSFVLNTTKENLEDVPDEIIEND